MQTEYLIKQLEKYELSQKEALIYIHLLQKGTDMSVVEISHGLKLGRTPIYNALDCLENKGLVRHVISSSGFRFAATSPDNLQYYWDDRTRLMQDKTKELSPVIESLEQLEATAKHKSKISYFSGQRGMEQLTYNSLKADGDLYIYEMATDMTAFIDPSLAENYRQILVDRSITTHQLTNFDHFGQFTKVERMVKDYWDIRYIDPKILRIKFEMIIYNDICTLYSYKDNEPFGVEIQNVDLAEMQKQIFCAIQQSAIPLRKIDWFGGAKLG